MVWFPGMITIYTNFARRGSPPLLPRRFTFFLKATYFFALWGPAFGRRGSRTFRPRSGVGSLPVVGREDGECVKGVEWLLAWGRLEATPARARPR